MNHTLHVHRANTPGNGPVVYFEATDRHTAHKLRWAYLILRRDGVQRHIARMVIMTTFLAGASVGDTWRCAWRLRQERAV